MMKALTRFVIASSVALWLQAGVSYAQESGLVGPPVASTSKLIPARIFGSGMVLQRDRMVPVWGTGPEGESVTVSFAAQQKSTLVKDGRWRIELDPMPASADGAALVIAAPGQEITFTDVVVGDVWLAAGQSNMQFRVDRCRSADEVLRQPEDASLRFFITPPALGPRALTLPAQWERCGPSTVGRFSAVAYFFAAAVRRSTDLPIGIVQCAHGGSWLESWASPEIMAAGWPEFENHLATKSESFLNEHPQMRPSVVHERMYSTIVPYAIKGVIWYQGESNAGLPKAYRELFPEVVGMFRDDFKAPDLPVYFVQLPRYEGGNWTGMREAQLDLWKSIPGTFMAVTIDLPRDFNPGDGAVHPNTKRPVGERLARAVCRYEYGRSWIVPSGPRFSSVRVDRDAIRIQFDFADGGLQTLDGGPLRGVYGGPDVRRMLPLEVKLSGDSMVIDLSERDVNALKFVRYGSEVDCGAKNLDVNLGNGAGLPASPFTCEIPDA